MLLKKVYEEFEEHRRKMEEAGLLYGLHDSRVLQYSKKLNDIYNLLIKLRYPDEELIG
ncbi:Spo0E family sporulation regulatory protein-aspartic acid phosphatase [Ammoniphilus sp. 3BR4]|uniref:Spo0E family sporulation regulatory protein-aspartic acid phosphatase n=1 Tax=Ammoniphilus sp. 3BR4 TaxID=3158265 RepID=UPI0034651A50